jgi:ADP-ribosylation factor-binding protein GGA
LLIQVLKTEDQLEAEDREAQGAKLENLLRIGTPAALAEANDLMKIMSGYVN